MTENASRNIVYRSDEIARFYGANRDAWEGFYPSERWVFEQVAARRADGLGDGLSGGLGGVLDVGCAAGGLGHALAQRRLLTNYTGIDINPQAIEAAGRKGVPMGVTHAFIAGDLLEARDLDGRAFDTVFSLSCVDWNVELERMIDRCWELVAPGGTFILSVRLTDGPGVTDMTRSYQYVAFGDDMPEDAEKAPYAVLNVSDMIGLLSARDPMPSHILGYGYWGPPSRMARTPFQSVVFAVFALTRPRGQDDQPADQPVLELRLPWSVWRRQT